MREQQCAGELLRVGMGGLILKGPQAMLTSQDFIRSSGDMHLVLGAWYLLSYYYR